MLDKILKLFLGDTSKRTLSEINPIIDSVKAAEHELQNISDQALRAETEGFRQRLRAASEVQIAERDLLKIQADSEVDVDAKDALYRQIDAIDQEVLALEERILIELLPRAFAVLRETARRLNNGPLRLPATDWDREMAAKIDAVELEGDTAVWKNQWLAAGNAIAWNMVHYDVQLFGGVVLHKGRIAEMATGEGKTLVATLPVYLNALSGRGVHLVTVNDYLSKRDSEWMGPLYQFHGLSVDCIDKHRPNTEARRKAYLADITFGTNNEFGFDYLRDNMAREAAELVQRWHHYAIVDEVDSVLIDDARTPLIISGPTPNGDKQEFDSLKGFVVSLIAQQKSVAQDALAQAKELLANGDKTQGGFQLLRSHRALPKNKALIKFLSEDGNKALLQKTEGLYLQDQGKEMKKIDEALYFTI